MRKSISKFFAATIICMTLSLGAMAGDISSGRTGDISSGKCGDISCGRTAPVSIKDTIFAEVARALTGILLGD